MDELSFKDKVIKLEVVLTFDVPMEKHCLKVFSRKRVLR